MFSKKIHFCWYGNGDYNDVIKKCINSWKEKLPDYEIKKWDESNTPFSKFPFLKLLYKQKNGHSYPIICVYIQFTQKVEFI